MNAEYFIWKTVCKSALAAFALGVFLQACSVVGPPKPTPRPVPVPTAAEPEVRYEKVGWSRLPGWEDDDVREAWPAFLKSCGLLEADGIIVTIHDQDGIDEIVKVARALRPDILIVSRARDATHARHLYAIGVTDAVPETIESSLQLSEAALVGLGLPTGLVIASIHEKRDEFRHELQEAAGRAGQAETHAIRPKTLRKS